MAPKAPKAQSRGARSSTSQLQELSSGRARSSTAYQASGITGNGKKLRSRVLKTVDQPPKKIAVVRRECVLCASKRMEKNFKRPEDIDICAHFHNTCKSCVEMLLKGRIADRRLQDGNLACPFPDCRFVLSFPAVKEIVSHSLLRSWGAALVEHHLRSSDNFIACLNSECGHHFSIEGCGKEHPRSRKNIACPYCDFELCIECHRPWHGKTGCARNKTEEDKMSEVAVKLMGAKPCPKCGAYIQKEGGCNHITCTKCWVEFCWSCLMVWRNGIEEHSEGCGNRLVPRGPAYQAMLNRISGAGRFELANAS
ncbi:hypothetical protein CC78DRAFT_589037 [Lojkania enalia]|uniref:RBR-type E3 ubiquitin transferase n=1 Tax=Lojkania enalia TaxID=147567 RepID=A0A9P4NDD6_9PLEO|nr:hypothetical protein CC78DRAFT_589037 [Didymosphaeria enalia]